MIALKLNLNRANNYFAKDTISRYVHRKIMRQSKEALQRPHFSSFPGINPRVLLFKAAFVVP